MNNREVEDGMGFKGLVPTAAERAHERETARLKAEVKQLTNEVERLRSERVGHVLVTETDNATYDRLCHLLLPEDNYPAMSVMDADDVLRDIINERNQLRADAATPRAETGLTVEAALKELREMLPRHYCSVSHEGRLILLMGLKLKEIETVARIRITSATAQDAMLPVEVDADTLEEAMQEVRAWTKSRAEREGGESS